MKVTTKLKLNRETKGKRTLSEAPSPESAPAEQGRLPRVTKLMALAIKFDQMIRDGVVKNMAELARLGHVTRARITQIMNLLNLAPDIQEWLLFLPRVPGGEEPVGEREMRPVAGIVCWIEQRKRWSRERDGAVRRAGAFRSGGYAMISAARVPMGSHSVPVPRG